LLNRVTVGACLSVAAIASAFGKDLFDRLPIMTSLSNLSQSKNDKVALKSCLLLNLELAKSIDPLVLTINYLSEQSLTLWYSTLIELVPDPEFLQILALVLSEVSKRLESEPLEYEPKSVVHPIVFLIQQYLKFLNDSNPSLRYPIMKYLNTLINQLDISILPYLVLFVVPVLGRLHDQDANVRNIANSTFGLMMNFLPLDSSEHKGTGINLRFLSEDLLERREQERTFITQLLDPSKIEPFKLPIRINAELRSYQQDGLNWLKFLNRYKLHGILCDDMVRFVAFELC
jgi:hypothetical protein